MILFHTHSYEYLARRICTADRRFQLGEIDRKFFSDGERYIRLKSDVKGQSVVLVGGTISDQDTLELFDLACGLVGAHAEQLTLVIPYFGYSTMDRAVYPGEIVTAKTRAQLLSFIPHARASNRIILLDLHSEGIPYYFESNLVTEHLQATAVTVDQIKRAGGSDFILGCTDAGRAKWVQRMGNQLRVPVSFVYKRRNDDGSTEVTATANLISGKRVVIYDDMIRSGGSLINAARSYLAAGATAVHAVATHGVFCGKATVEQLLNADCVEKIYCTDSHPQAIQLKSDRLVVDSVAPVFAKALVLD